MVSIVSISRIISICWVWWGSWVGGVVLGRVAWVVPWVGRKLAFVVRGRL